VLLDSRDFGHAHLVTQVELFGRQLGDLVTNTFPRVVFGVSVLLDQPENLFLEFVVLFGEFGGSRICRTSWRDRRGNEGSGRWCYRRSLSGSSRVRSRHLLTVNCRQVRGATTQEDQEDIQA